MVRPLSRASKSPVVFWACVGRATTPVFVCAGASVEACGVSARGGACCAVSVFASEQLQTTETRTDSKPNEERCMSGGLAILLFETTEPQIFGEFRECDCR